MAKFIGAIGFVTTGTPSKGVVLEVPIERNYTGDILRGGYRWDEAQKINADMVVQNNRISIIADTFAMSNLGNIRYVLQNGTRWAVTSVETIWPRLIISLGSVYNGPVYVPEED